MVCSLIFWWIDFRDKKCWGGLKQSSGEDSWFNVCEDHEWSSRADRSKSSINWARDPRRLPAQIFVEVLYFYLFIFGGLGERWGGGGGRVCAVKSIGFCIWILLLGVSLLVLLIIQLDWTCKLCSESLCPLQNAFYPTLWAGQACLLKIYIGINYH